VNLTEVPTDTEPFPERGRGGASEALGEAAHVIQRAVREVGGDGDPNQGEYPCHDRDPGHHHYDAAA